MVSSNNLSNSVFVDIYPYTTSGMAYSEIHLHESIGGALAWGTIDFEHNDSEISRKAIKDSENNPFFFLTLKGKTIQYTAINCYIISKKEFGKLWCIKFVCVPSKGFFEETRSLIHKGADAAIDYCYGKSGIINRNCRSDINQDLEFIQFQETDMNFLTKVLKSYKKDIVFAYGLEGLLIKEIRGTSSLGINEKNESGLPILISGTQNIKTIESGASERNFIFEKSPHDGLYEDLDGKDVKRQDLPEKYQVNSKNISTVITHEGYSLVHKDFILAKKIYDHNDRFLTSSMFKNIVIEFVGVLPEMYKLGDLVYYINNDTPELVRKSTPKNHVYMIIENDFLITRENSKSSEFGVEVKSTLKCIQDEVGNYLNW